MSIEVQSSKHCVELLRRSFEKNSDKKKLKVTVELSYLLYINLAVIYSQQRITYLQLSVFSVAMRVYADRKTV